MRLFLSSLLLAGAAVGPASADPALQQAIARDYATSLRPLWDHFHRNPELSTLEVKTAARLAQELRALGIDVTEKVGGTGLVGVVRNGNGPTALIRADMDGLPVEEKSGLPNASKIRQTDIDGVEKPVMHACGHDTHITALVGTARQLLANKSKWQGTLVLVAQPAEERVRGASAMLKDGLYTRFPKPDYALAFHVDSSLPEGVIRVPEGTAYSSSDNFSIIVHGQGAHGASPHRGKDPVLLASEIVVALQQLVSREKPPLEAGVVTVGSIHGGTKHNIIPDQVELLLTVRSNSEAVRAQLLDGIKRIAQNMGRVAGLPEDKLPEVNPPSEATPVTSNDPDTARRLKAVLLAGLGADRVTDTPRDNMGAEDFAFFVAPDTGVKGVYFQVGGTPPADFAREKAGGAPVPSHHSPLFKISPEPTIKTGVAAMVLAVYDLLPKR